MNKKEIMPMLHFLTSSISCIFSFLISQNLRNSKINLLYIIIFLSLGLTSIPSQFAFSISEQISLKTNSSPSSAIVVDGHKYILVEDRFSKEIKDLTEKLLLLTVPLLAFAIFGLLFTYGWSVYEKKSQKKDTLYSIFQEVINNTALVLNNENLAVKKKNSNEPEYYIPRTYKKIDDKTGSTEDKAINFGNFYFETNAFKSIQNSGYLTTLNKINQRNINDLYEHILLRNNLLYLLDKYEKQRVFINLDSQDIKNFFEEKRLEYFHELKMLENRITELLILKTLISLSMEIKETRIWKLPKTQRYKIKIAKIENKQLIKNTVKKLSDEIGDEIYNDKIDPLLKKLNSIKS